MSIAQPHDQNDSPVEVVPEGPNQKHELLIFDKKRPPRDEENRPVFALRSEDKVPVCGSKKSGGGYCEQTARYSNGRCRNHGGPSPKGPASPQWKTGVRSKYMPPPNLLARYQAALNDPELNHHRDSIAMVDSLIGELLVDYEAGAGPRLWKKVQTLYGKLQVAERAGATNRAREHFEELGYVIEQGQRHSNQSEWLLRLLAERRKHADSETRRKLSESMVYTVEEAYAFYTAMGTAIKKHVSNEAERDAILNEITAIAGDAGATGGSGPAPHQGGDIHCS